ncbi:MAG: TetR/AcrR family transcriptional regulator [Bacteroidales bacterium]|nr:TetR/AcrR family transcriptional regulator [Bacteroidales bacterium]
MGIHERKEREKLQRRNEIIDAAEKVFFTKGIENATMDEVAEEAELSKGTLYLYFNNKEDLHFAICMRGLVMLKEKFEQAISKNNTVLHNLVQIGLTFVKFSKEHSDYFKVMSHFEGKNPDEREHRYQHTEKDNVMDVMVKLIEQGKKDGSIRNDINPNIIAHILWAQTTGVLQLMAVKKFHLEMFDISEEDIIKSHFEIVANGIRPGAEPLDLIQYFK